MVIGTKMIIKADKIIVPIPESNNGEEYSVRNDGSIAYGVVVPLSMRLAVPLFIRLAIFSKSPTKRVTQRMIQTTNTGIIIISVNK